MAEPAVPKTFTFNVAHAELVETAHKLLDGMDQQRNQILTEAANYLVYKNGGAKRAAEYNHFTCRLASILAELTPDEIPEMAGLITEKPILLRYDPHNTKTLEIIDAPAMKKFYTGMDGLIEKLDNPENADAGYHILQAIKYLGKKKPQPYQHGFKPQELTEEQKETLVEELFKDKARLINKPNENVLNSLARLESEAYRPIERDAQERLFGPAPHDEFTLTRNDFRDMIVLQCYDGKTGEYIDPDEFDKDDKEWKRAKGDMNRKDLFLLKLDDVGYFMMSHDDEFSGQVLYLDSFAPEKMSEAAREKCDSHLIKEFSKLASALGYLAVATHWLPGGPEHQNLLNAGFNQVDFKRNFSFPGSVDHGVNSDAVILWKVL